MTGKLIDAEKLKKHYAWWDDDERRALFDQIVDAQPTIDAEPVRHGKWKWLSCTYDRVPKEMEYECSECHHKTIVHGDNMPWEKYCPNCGCRMDAEDDKWI